MKLPVLVADARHCWKWLSVQFIVAAGAVQTAITAFPDVLRQYVPDWVMHAAAIGLLVAAVAGRLVDQPNAKGKPNVDPS